MGSPYTISNTLFTAQSLLKNITPNYKNESIWILKKILQLETATLLLNNTKLLTASEHTLFTQLINRRCAREPLQYILETISFCGYDFEIAKDVFIPRPETELFLNIFNQNISYKKNVLEVGCGLGCISIILSIKKLAKEITSIDINPKAITAARNNAQKFKCENIQFLNQDFFKMNYPVKYDLIISNPPYIPIIEVKDLDSEVKFYDPLSALTDYNDGLSFYKYCANFGRDLIYKGGFMLLEFGGTNQLNDIQEIFDSQNYKFTIFNDLNTRPRFILVKV